MSDRPDPAARSETRSRLVGGDPRSLRQRLDLHGERDGPEIRRRGSGQPEFLGSLGPQSTNREQGLGQAIAGIGGLERPGDPIHACTAAAQASGSFSPDARTASWPSPDEAPGGRRQGHCEDPNRGVPGRWSRRRPLSWPCPGARSSARRCPGPTARSASALAISRRSQPRYVGSPSSIIFGASSRPAVAAATAAAGSPRQRHSSASMTNEAGSSQVVAED